MWSSQSKLLHDIEDHVEQDNSSLLDVWMSHGDQVRRLPPEFVLYCKYTQ